MTVLRPIIRALGGLTQVEVVSQLLIDQCLIRFEKAQDDVVGR